MTEETFPPPSLWDLHGGPAFPSSTEKNHGGRIDYKGMTLRDWFAAQVMGGLADWSPVLHTTEYRELWRIRAEFAYGQADAMLAARNQTED